MGQYSSIKTFNTQPQNRIERFVMTQLNIALAGALGFSALFPSVICGQESDGNWRFKETPNSYLSLPTATIEAKNTVFCPDASRVHLRLQCDDYNGRMIHIVSDCYFYTEFETSEMSVDNGTEIAMFSFRNLGSTGQISILPEDTMLAFVEHTNGFSDVKIGITPYLQDEITFSFDLSDIERASLPVFLGCFRKDL